MWALTRQGDFDSSSLDEKAIRFHIVHLKLQFLAILLSTLALKPP